MNFIESIYNFTQSNTNKLNKNIFTKNAAMFTKIIKNLMSSTCKKDEVKYRTGINNRTIMDLYSEMLLFKANLKEFFNIYRDLILKYYPDANMPENSGIILSIIGFGEFVQKFVCQSTETTQRLFCDPLNNQVPKNIKEYICFNTEAISKFNCDNIVNIIALLRQMLVNKKYY